MEVTPKSQIAELIRSSQTILLLSHANPDGDAIGSGLALKTVLEKIGKKADFAVAEVLPEYCTFLPGFSNITSTVSGNSDLVITIDTRSAEGELKLGQKKLPEEKRLVIIVSPETGSLAPEDVVASRSRPKYDLVIFLDCGAAELIGPIYQDISDLMYEAPTVSIDHHATNKYFAKINWVDMTATSTAEMLVSLIESLSRGEMLLDPDVATCLLTGLMTDTSSFQNSNTTPKSLTVAAQLVASGARQQDIVEQVFKTKPLSTLKLWGKILSNIHEEVEGNFVWATISAEEAESVGANASSAGGAGLVDELLKTTEGVDFVLLLSERNGMVHGNLRSVNKSFNVADLAKIFGGGGHVPAAGFAISGDFKTTTPEVISKIKQTLASKMAAPTTTS